MADPSPEVRVQRHEGQELQETPAPLMPLLLAIGILAAGVSVGWVGRDVRALWLLVPAAGLAWLGLQHSRKPDAGVSTGTSPAGESPPAPPPAIDAGSDLGAKIDELENINEGLWNQIHAWDGDG